MEMEMIGNSTISWKMLEEDFSKELSLNIKTGPRRSIQQIGKGKGFLSKIYRLDFDWQLPERIPENSQKPPEKCALKISSLDVILELFHNVGSDQKKHLAEYYTALLSNNELFFYQNFSKLSLTDLRIPKYYCGRKYDEKKGNDKIYFYKKSARKRKRNYSGYLAMELMENAVVQHIFDEIEENQIYKILFQMAFLNGSSLFHTDLIQTFIDSDFSNQFIEDFNTKEKTVKGIHLCMENFPEKKEKLEKLLPVAEIFADHRVYLRLRKMNCPIDLLCQGDLWPPNVMWTRDTENAENAESPEKYKLKAILDWQQVHLGNPLEDLVKWLSLSIHPQQYSQSIDKFLKFYYENLLKFAKGRPIPWKDYDDFKKQYELMYVWQTALYCPVVANAGDLIFEGIEDESKISPLRQVYHQKFLVMIDESEELLKKWKDDVLGTINEKKTYK